MKGSGDDRNLTLGGPRTYCTANDSNPTGMIHQKTFAGEYASNVMCATANDWRADGALSFGQACRDRSASNVKINAVACSGSARIKID